MEICLSHVLSDLQLISKLQTDAHSLLLWETAAADPVSLPFIFGGLLSKTPPSDTGPLERGEHASRVRGSEKSPHTLAL